nr:retrovirus-related Pol polyprotein from transposon TNT 1-94 [Tanacetum cinerariifolium]
MISLKALILNDNKSTLDYTGFTTLKLSDVYTIDFLISGISSLQQGELSSLAVGTSSGSGNSSLAVRMPCVFYSQQTTFWAEAVNTACYVQNRVLVVKPHNKIPYELFHGRTPTLSFIRPFWYPSTILNTKDHLGKFYDKADEGFFIGYSLNSKSFRVFNRRTMIVEENLHIRFSENTPNVVGSRADWLFDIVTLTRIMYYEPIVAGTQSNVIADPKSSWDDGFNSSSDDGKKVDEDLRNESECKDQEKEDTINITKNVNIVSSTVNAAGTNEANELPFDPNMPVLEDVGTFDFSNKDKDDDAVADINNLDTTIQVSRTPTTRIHKDHPSD